MQNLEKILFEKNSKEWLFPASTTKVMTAILTVENCNLQDKVKLVIMQLTLFLQLIQLVLLNLVKFFYSRTTLKSYSYIFCK